MPGQNVNYEKPNIPPEYMPDGFRGALNTTDVDELERLKERLQERIAELEETLEEQKLEEILLDCVRVVCGDCKGEGMVPFMSPSDNADVDFDRCETCAGRGWHYAEEWKEAKTHQHDGVYGQTTIHHIYP